MNTDRIDPQNSRESHGQAVQRTEPRQNYKDCLSCRIVGSATFAGVGSYALWQARAAAPGNPWQKRIVGGLGLALLAGGVVRWLQ